MWIIPQKFTEILEVLQMISNSLNLQLFNPYHADQTFWFLHCIPNKTKIFIRLTKIFVLSIACLKKSVKHKKVMYKFHYFTCIFNMVNLL